MALSTFDINIKAEYYDINISALDALPAQYNALVIVCAYLSVRPFVCSSHLTIVSKNDLWCFERDIKPYNNYRGVGLCRISTGGA